MNDQNPNQILEKILEITGYTDDRQVFVNDFFTLCQQQATSDLLATLSEEKKQNLKLELETEQTAEKKKEILTNYFSEDEHVSAFEKATSLAFQQYLGEVIPVLDEAKKNELQRYFQSLSPQK